MKGKCQNDTPREKIFSKIPVLLSLRLRMLENSEKSGKLQDIIELVNSA